MRFRQIFFSFILPLSLMAMSLGLPARAYADLGTQPWNNTVCTHTTADGDQVATIQGFQCLIANFLQIAVSAIGLAGFVMLIVGSFKFLTSGGNAKGTDEGKRTLTFAVVGLVVALSAWFILNIVAQFTGVCGILQFYLQIQDKNGQIIQGQCVDANSTSPAPP